MDGTTEPIVSVIGHPIAGNPSQFALEKALKAMHLDWRVLSFDVEPESVSLALDGAEVLGIRGVLVDSSVSSSAASWYRGRHPDSALIDCLTRDADGRFVGCHQQRGWLDSLVQAHQRRLDRELKDCLWLGGQDDLSLIDPTPFHEPPLSSPPDSDEVTAADLIVIANTVSLEADDWPAGQSDTLVVDLTDGHPDIDKIQSLQYQVITAEHRRIGTLSKCLALWTEVEPPDDVIHDAIEEYLAV